MWTFWKRTKGTKGTERTAEGDPAKVNRLALEAFALAEPDTPWWRMIQDVLALQIKQESAGAMLPGIGSEDRHYNAGRAAALEDFQRMLIEKWIESRAKP